MLEQMNIFQFIDSGIKPYSIDKPIRLIELRAKAGFKIFAASIEPSLDPAPESK